MIQLYATLVVIGLILTGSDGPCFPWLNFVGCLLAVTCMYLANRSLTNVHI